MHGFSTWLEVTLLLQTPRINQQKVRDIDGCLRLGWGVGPRSVAKHPILHTSPHQMQARRDPFTVLCDIYIIIIDMYVDDTRFFIIFIIFWLCDLLDVEPTRIAQSCSTGNLAKPCGCRSPAVALGSGSSGSHALPWWLQQKRFFCVDHAWRRCSEFSGAAGCCSAAACFGNKF